MDTDDMLLQSFAEAITMATNPPGETPSPPPTLQNSPETPRMSSHGVNLEEKLWIDECYLFQDESLGPVFCKSKLIPLKTITTQKLEKMQKEQMEKVQVAERQTPDVIEEEEEREEAPTTSDAKEADVWTADD